MQKFCEFLFLGTEEKTGLPKSGKKYCFFMSNMIKYKTSNVVKNMKTLLK